MRFDYVGTGDSEGDVGYDRLDSWLDDIAATAEELKRSEPVSNIALGGLRAGGMLALLASQRMNNVRSLLLWEPVTDGARYVRDIRRLHARMLNDLERFARRRHADDSSDDELIGTRYPTCLLREIERRTSEQLSPPSDCDIALVGSIDPLRVSRRTHRVAPFQDHGWNDARRISEMIMDPGAVRHFTHSMNTLAA